MQLDGKIALITGGGTGVGQAIAKSFAEAGAQVIITGRRQDKLEQTCAEIQAAKLVRYFVADVADRAQVAALIDWINRDFGPLDIVVNNAGVNIRERRIEELKPEAWQYVFDINTNGVFNVIHAVLPQMRARRDGLLITISSLGGIRPSTLAGAAYSASKHAVNALMQVIALEEKDNGIRSTILAPGEINTPILDDRPVKVSDEHRARILQPEDVAAAALFIAGLPARVHVPELLIKPITQVFV